MPARATAPARGLTWARRRTRGARRGRALLTGEVRERGDFFGADQDGAVEEAQELPGRLYLPAEAEMLRGLGRGRRARGSRQEHGARRGGARVGSPGGGPRHMAGRVSDQWLRRPPPPPGSGCQSLLPRAGQHRLPSQGEGAENGRGEEPREGSA